jgi:hypothetical protein
MPRSNSDPQFDNPLNGCRECGQDFSALKYFDAHRVGVHAYTITEGLKLDPPREDGRRCLSTKEMQDRGWVKDRYGRWTDPSNAAKVREHFDRLKAESAVPA